MAHDHTFRFGVQAGGSHDPAAWRELARKIEGLGYSTLFMPDHFIDTELAPMVGISFAAAATEQLRVGMLVLGNDYKHPAVTAKEAATVDVLSEGRLEFGLGAGWMQTDYEALGLAYDSPGVRIERLEEALRDRQGGVGRPPVRPLRRELHHSLLQRHPETHPATPAADRHRRRRPSAAAPRRTRSRHRRHQPQPAGGRHHRRRDPVGGRRPDPPEDRVGPGRSRRPLRRPRAPDPLLPRRHHRRRTRARGGPRSRVRAHRRRGAQLRDGPGRHDRRGLRDAAGASGDLGRVVHRGRGRQLRELRPGRRPARGHVRLDRGSGPEADRPQPCSGRARGPAAVVRSPAPRASGQPRPVARPRGSPASAVPVRPGAAQVTGRMDIIGW